MALKRIPSDDEINALVARFLALWSPGEVIRPWLRQHAEMLLELVQSGWSWAAIARAMTQAGITYRTGKPWTADWLQSDAYRARLPLKGYRRRGQTSHALGQETGAAPSPPMPSIPAQHTLSDHPAPMEEPEFQPATFIDWDAKRSAAPATPVPAPAAPIIQQPPSASDDVIERLLGKKP
jgi:hypothetical protein